MNSAISGCHVDAVVGETDDSILASGAGGGFMGTDWAMVWGRISLGLGRDSSGVGG